MKKVRLEIEALEVESFQTDGGVGGMESDITGVLICGVQGNGSLEQCGGYSAETGCSPCPGTANTHCNQNTCAATCGVKNTCWTCPDNMGTRCNYTCVGYPHCTL